MKGKQWNGVKDKTRAKYCSDTKEINYIGRMLKLGYYYG